MTPSASLFIMRLTMEFAFPHRENHVDRFHGTGLHYPSDILAGWALAAGCVTTASFVTRIPFQL